MGSCSSSSTEGTFSISGKLEGIGAPFFMCAVEHYTDSIVVDTVRLNAKGEFNYRAKVDGLKKVSLYFSNDQIAPLFVDENTDIEIEGNVSDIYSLKIKGGEINDAVWGFKQRNRKLIEAGSPILVDSVKSYVSNNKESVASLALIELYLKGKIPSSKIDSLVHTMSETMMELPYTKNILFDINVTKRAEIGFPASDFNLKSIKGKNVKLSDYTNKPILLTFVESEDSLMLKLYSEIEKENPSISILSLMLETERSKIKDAKKDYLIDNKGWASDLISNYNVKSAPYYVLIDSSKLIKGRGSLDQNVIKIIQKLREDKK